MNLTNKRHDLVAIEIFDPKEEYLSGMGLITMKDLETGNRCLIDTNSKTWRHYYRLNRLKFDEEKRTFFHQYGIDHLRVQTDQPFEKDLINFFKKRHLKK